VTSPESNKTPKVWQDTSPRLSRILCLWNHQCRSMSTRRRCVFVSTRWRLLSVSASARIGSLAKITRSSTRITIRVSAGKVDWIHHFQCVYRKGTGSSQETGPWSGLATICHNLVLEHTRTMDGTARHEKLPPAAAHKENFGRKQLNNATKVMMAGQHNPRPLYESGMRKSTNSPTTQRQPIFVDVGKRKLLRPASPFGIQ
jgi:hypothetical protein